MAEWLAHISPSFSGSGNPNCLVKCTPPPLQIWRGCMLTSLYVIGKTPIHLGPGLVSVPPADAARWADLHRLIPESLKERRKKLNTAARVFLL